MDKSRALSQSLLKCASLSMQMSHVYTGRLFADQLFKF